MVLVAGFTLLAGIYTLGSLQGVRTIVIGPADVPSDVYICSGFRQSQGVLYDSGGNRRHYQLIGDCAAAFADLPDVMISELEYRGWTVHSDGAGNLDAYSYASHEELTASLGESQNDPGITNIALDIYTGYTRPPDDFPDQGPSPSPRA